MYQAVKSVKTLKNYKLKLTFMNDEEKVFDMKKYLSHGVFQELKNEKLFRKVHVNFDSIEWENGADLDPEILYNESI